jgi:hypothetical protein
MGNRGGLLDAVAEVEDVGAAGEGVKDSADRVLQRFAAADQRQGIEIALHRHPVGQLAIRPIGIGGLVDADGVDAAFARIGAKLAAGRRELEDKRLRMMNEVPGILTALIVVLVIVRPF